MVTVHLTLLKNLWIIIEWGGGHWYSLHNKKQKIEAKEIWGSYIIVKKNKKQNTEKKFTL